MRKGWECGDVRERERSELKGHREVALARFGDWVTSLKWGPWDGRGPERPRKEHDVMKGEGLSSVVVCWVCDTQGGQDLGMPPRLLFIVILLFLF